MNRKPLQLVKPLLADYLYVCHNLREDERRQFEALGLNGEAYDPEQAAIGMASRSGPKWALVEQDGVPLVIGGFDLIRAGVWQDFLLGTDEAWEKYWRSISKNCRRVMDKMLATEAHRLQCVSLASRTDAHKWYRVLGYQYEATLRGYGGKGEDAVMYSIVNREEG